MDSMDRETAIEKLHKKYARYGITKKLLHELFLDGIENQHFELEDVFQLLRMTLGMEYGEEELFTVSTVARLTGQTETEVLKAIAQTHQPTVSGFRVFLPNGVNDL